MRALFRMLHAVKVVVVAFVCLMIGFSARQLFDAYAKERIPFLREADPDSEAYEAVTPDEGLQLMADPVMPHAAEWWNNLTF
jgi:hypothetical protein